MTFVACLSRLGTYTVTGPVTGKRWAVSKSGTWIDRLDAEMLVDTKIQIYCGRVGKDIEIRPLHYVTPTSDQMRANKGSMKDGSL